MFKSPYITSYGISCRNLSFLSGNHGEISTCTEMVIVVLCSTRARCPRFHPPFPWLSLSGKSNKSPVRPPSFTPSPPSISKHVPSVPSARPNEARQHHFTMASNPIDRAEGGREGERSRNATTAASRRRSIWGDGMGGRVCRDVTFFA